MREEFWLLEPSRSIYERAETNEPSESLHRESILDVQFTSKRFKDLIWTQYSHFLINDRTINLFKDEGFTGYVTRPVYGRMKMIKKGYDSTYDDEDFPGFHLKQVEEIEIPPYYEFTVTGWGGMAAADSGIVRMPGVQKWEGLPKWECMVDEAQWDGSDFFFVWPFPRHMFVTTRAAQFIKRNKLTGGRLISPEDYSKEYSQYNIKGAGPYPLYYYLPEDRARRFGEPLDIY